MLSIRNQEVERLARELAGARGTSMTETILDALLRRKDEEARRADRRKAVIQAIAAACAAAPDYDMRAPEDILGYDETGGFGNGGR